MGYFWPGLPPFVLEWARTLLPLQTSAVETGTFEGDTTALLADFFGSCTTIERSDALYARARDRFGEDSRVTVLHGSSKALLSSAVPSPEDGCFAWLDAHGFYDYSGPDTDENPLLAEIETLLACRADSPTVIAIDDARGMGTQPEWPPLQAILSTLHRGDYASVIVDDCLVAAPTSLAPDFTALYRASRMVEVPAVFHIWPWVRSIVKVRATTDEWVARTRDWRDR